MGLDPKPTSQNALLGWDELNNHLQMIFKTSTKNNSQFAEINPNIFKMSEKEIIEEATKKGYIVEDMPNGKLRIT